MAESLEFSNERQRLCDVPECPESGLYRAPMSRGNLRSYYWFCLEHVRYYNQAWDYYKGMGEAEIESDRRFDVVWRRPSWKMGPDYQGQQGTTDAFRDDFELFGKASKSGRKRPETPEIKALQTLGLEADADLATVKARYKTLAKKFHPDRNGGDTSAEERLKKVNQAYSLLKKSFTS